jgi:hypothetical protein
MAVIAPGSAVEKLGTDSSSPRMRAIIGAIGAIGVHATRQSTGGLGQLASMRRANWAARPALQNGVRAGGPRE